MSTKILASALVIAGAVAIPALAQAEGTAIAIDALQVHEDSTFGPYLTDASGRPLYAFSADKQAQGSDAAVPACMNPCLSAWPQAMAISDKPKAGDKIAADKIGLLTRPDGKLQVTYAGWPLYYYHEDEGAEGPHGQAAQGFGGEWHLVAPDGSRIERKAS